MVNTKDLLHLTPARKDISSFGDRKITFPKRSSLPNGLSLKTLGRAKEPASLNVLTGAPVQLSFTWGKKNLWSPSHPVPTTFQNRKGKVSLDIGSTR
jgi:hypothetical protein